MASIFIRTLRTLVLGALCVVGLSTCGVRDDGRTLQYSKIVGALPQKVVEKSFSRKAITAASLQGDAINSMRIVPVFRRGDEMGAMDFPTYRLFDVQSGSIYSMVGLENADVLLAANDLVVLNPEGFKIFVTTVIPKQNTSTITIRRDGITTELRVTLLDP